MRAPPHRPYGLYWLRLAGLIRHQPHRNRYVATKDGLCIAAFYTKIYNWLVVHYRRRASTELRQAVRTLDRHVDRARLTPAA